MINKKIFTEIMCGEHRESTISEGWSTLYDIVFNNVENYVHEVLDENYFDENGYINDNKDKNLYITDVIIYKEIDILNIDFSYTQRISIEIKSPSYHRYDNSWTFEGVSIFEGW